ncbi:MAG TPA: hypothetical protein VK858_10675 [Longimicrobiales bacterium]|nr:hypothetical protein [Longimicrobiales bacterium]
MILPNIRASFTRQDAQHLVTLLGRHDRDILEAARERLEIHGVDALLDDPRILNALLTDPDVQAPPHMVFYVLVRQALLEAGVDDPATADFVASVVVAFGQARRAWRVSETDEEEYDYLVDLLDELRDADSRRAFLLSSHLGNYSLWLAGLFPDRVAWRTRRRGAPDLDYYDRVGAGGYRVAARSGEARTLQVDGVLGGLGRDFPKVRTALNRVAERHLWPGQGDPVERMLRGLRRDQG